MSWILFYDSGDAKVRSVKKVIGIGGNVLIKLGGYYYKRKVGAYCHGINEKDDFINYWEGMGYIVDGEPMESESGAPGVKRIFLNLIKRTG